MLAVAVVNNHEGGVGGGCGRAADEEDLLLTRLRQMQSTLRECHWRLDRTDRWAESLFRKGEEEGMGKDLPAPYSNGKEEPLESDPCVREGDVSVCDKKPRRRRLVVREGVCKESIIESEVVEELVLRKEWEDDFGDYDNRLMTDAFLREGESTTNAAKEVKKNPKAKARLERQNSLDEEDPHFTVLEPKSGPEGQPVEDVEEAGVHGKPMREKKSLSLPRNFDENGIHSFNSSPVSSECEYERKSSPSETPGSVWRRPRGGMRQANSLPILQGSFDFALEFALFQHLDSVEESLENLRLQFFTLKHAITHSNPGDSEFDLIFPDPWITTDQKEPKTQEPRSKGDPKHRDSSDETVNEDPADEDKAEHPNPEAPTVPEHDNGNEDPCSTKNKSESAEKTDNEDLCATSPSRETAPPSLSSENDLETTTHVTKEREKSQRTRIEARQYEDFQRCLMTVIIVFFLLLMLLLLACYLLVVVPFVTVSYRHAEGTAVF